MHTSSSLHDYIIFFMFRFQKYRLQTIHFIRIIVRVILVHDMVERSYILPKTVDYSLQTGGK